MVGRLTVGIPRWSPFSLVLFLVWMAPIFAELEGRIMEDVLSVPVEFTSYVDGLHCGLYDERRSWRGLEKVERRELKEELLDRVLVVLNKVAGEKGFPIAEVKAECLFMHSRIGRRGTRGVADQVEGLGLILDDELDFGQY